MEESDPRPDDVTFKPHLVIRDGKLDFIKEKFLQHKYGKAYKIHDVDIMGRIRLIRVEKVTCNSCSITPTNKRYIYDETGRKRNPDFKPIRHYERNLNYLFITENDIDLMCYRSPWGAYDSIYQNKKDSEDMILADPINHWADDQRFVNYKGNMDIDRDEIPIFDKSYYEKKKLREKNMKKFKEDEKTMSDDSSTGKKSKRILNVINEENQERTIKIFLKDRCRKERGEELKASEFAIAYENWRHENYLPPAVCILKTLKAYMKNHGYTSKRKNDGIYYLEVRLKTRKDETDDELRRRCKVFDKFLRREYEDDDGAETTIDEIEKVYRRWQADRNKRVSSDIKDIIKKYLKIRGYKYNKKRKCFVGLSLKLDGESSDESDSSLSFADDIP